MSGEWSDLVEDLTEVWHTHPDLGNDGRGSYRGPGLHTFLGMTWEQYAEMGPKGWDAIPAEVRPYIRAQHKRWVVDGPVPEVDRDDDWDEEGDEWPTECHRQGHQYAGTMSYPPMTGPVPADGPVASIAVCEREACLEEARQWVRQEVGREPTFSTYEENRAASRADANT